MKGVRKRKWETHTVTIWGSFCLIYGIGAIAFYLNAVYYSNLHLGWQFALFAADATTIEKKRKRLFHHSTSQTPL